MAKALGNELVGITDALETDRPDLLAVLGDRGEMLAGALAAIHLNIPVVHIHGGERSGTVDEPVRHAISKLAHYHFVTTESARKRLVKMGEVSDNIYVTGAPGLDGINDVAIYKRDELFDRYDLDTSQPLALLVYHGVLQEEEEAGQQVEAIIRALVDSRTQVVALAPNADVGGESISKILGQYSDNPNIHVLIHLPRPEYLSFLSAATLIIGNSSSGIIEAASFNLPVINVGRRQDLRDRSGNVIDVPAQQDKIAGALNKVLNGFSGPWTNIYGDGRAGERIVKLLSELSLDHSVLFKQNTY